MRDAALDTLYRREGRKVFATLVRLLGDSTLAEEALHDASAATRMHARSRSANNSSRPSRCMPFTPRPRCGCATAR